MKVSVCSDLHLELDDLVLPGGDILILSGDVCEAKNIKLDHYDKDAVQFKFEHKRSDRYARFFVEECAKYKNVIYVMGNHEHYGFTFHKTYNHLKNNLPSNITLLEKQHTELNGILFVGATLWTDMNNFDPLTMLHIKSRMNDYKTITMYDAARNVYHKLNSEYTVNEHVKTKQYFRQVLDQNRQGKKLPVVICTHHSPSKQSIHPLYADDYIVNGAYSSNLDEFILEYPEIKFWTHGHTHHTFNYKIGKCEIVCNPRGYAGYEQRSLDFDPTVGFDI